MELNKVIKVLMVERGISAKDMAAKAGITASYFSRITNGAFTPSLTTLGRIALALDVTVSELLARTENG